MMSSYIVKAKLKMMTSMHRREALMRVLSFKC